MNRIQTSCRLKMFEASLSAILNKSDRVSVNQSKQGSTRLPPASLRPLDAGSFCCIDVLLNQGCPKSARRPGESFCVTSDLC
ncbi:hypothetical protein AMECASPLE_018960 [Ameca splendens]|uniref:Uncharacterized protein n=1 Tax=Ameca splendens TaxID=208324 RepID=A0ABV0Y3B8_9TELE